MSKDLNFHSMILQVNSTMNYSYYFTIFCVYWVLHGDTYNTLGLYNFNGFL
jgi:hypothetical protein